jgi:hypothetical protein
MIELTGFDRAMFDVKRKKVNDQIKGIIKNGDFADDEEKVKAAIKVVEIYLGKYFQSCTNENEALELVNKVTVLRRQRIQLKRLIAVQVYSYSSNK